MDDRRRKLMNLRLILLDMVEQTALRTILCDFCILGLRRAELEERDESEQGLGHLNF